MTYRTYDGTNNNPVHPEWGSVGQPLLRLTTPAYSDGISRLAGQNRCNPRVVSNTICLSIDISLPNRRGLSDFIWAWGQFLDHELDLTEAAEPPEPADIQAPYNDPEIPNATIAVRRSRFDPTTGIDTPRQQINQISAYIDASNVYGFNTARANALRRFDGTGKLRTSEGDLLPFNTIGLHNATPPGADPDTFFLAGDIRANEHAVLSVLHTLFLREHNYQCEEIVKRHPHWQGLDEKIYQFARKIVYAEMQVITFKEFLPALLGNDAISPYTGYKPTANAGISNIFSTACYRVGHSMLSENIVLVDDHNHETLLSLRNAFFNPQLLIDYGIEPFLRGLARNVMQEIDPRIVESVRSFLFFQEGRSEAEGRLLDLAALNIQRGRDHGLGDYNRCRIDVGLPAKTCFAEITADTELQLRLQSVYGNVNNIDVWVGGLAEDHLQDASVGELIHSVLKDQFERLRDGDRFWYQNDPDLVHDVARLENTTLSDIIKRNTHISDIQDEVFFAASVPVEECPEPSKSEGIELDWSPEAEKL